MNQYDKNVNLPDRITVFCTSDPNWRGGIPLPDGKQYGRWHSWEAPERQWGRKQVYARLTPKSEAGLDAIKLLKALIDEEHLVSDTIRDFLDKIEE